MTMEQLQWKPYTFPIDSNQWTEQVLDDDLIVWDDLGPVENIQTIPRGETIRFRTFPNYGIVQLKQDEQSYSVVGRL